MASCPKCGKHLHIYNVSQFCPECGTNMTFYGFADTFVREAKMAELSQANVHVKIKRLKAAFIGSKLAIARLIVMLLPAVAFLIPAGGFNFSIPFSDGEIPFSGLGIYNLFGAGGFDYILSLMKSSFADTEVKALIAALGAYVFAAVIAVLVFLTSLLCFISYKNMQKITAVISVIGIADSFVTMFLYNHFAKWLSSGLISAQKGGPGLWVLALFFAVVFVVNLLLWIKGIPVEYGEGMEERTEIYKKVKRGEINIDDLPQPVIETEETRKIEEEIRKEEKAHEEKLRQKEATANG